MSGGGNVGARGLGPAIWRVSTIVHGVLDRDGEAAEGKGRRDTEGRGQGEQRQG